MVTHQAVRFIAAGLLALGVTVSSLGSSGLALAAPVHPAAHGYVLFDEWHPLTPNVDTIGQLRSRCEHWYSGGPDSNPQRFQSTTQTFQGAQWVHAICRIP